MNNLTLGNDGFTYYETLGGGQGACPEADGPSDVHVAMRRGSGGSGRQKGGEGVVRELEALEAMHYSLITERRRRAPQGASGGEDGQSGRDLLTHLLPGLDDGPATLEEPVALAQAMVVAGTAVVAATPHVSSRYPTARADIAAAATRLREALARAGVELDVREGAEVELVRTRDLSDEQLCELRLGGRRWLLVEPPLSGAAGNPVAEIEGLVARGHHVLLAHVERCPALRRSPDSVRRLVEEGVLVSITAASLTGDFGSQASSSRGGWFASDWCTTSPPMPTTSRDGLR